MIENLPTSGDEAARTLVLKVGYRGAGFSGYAEQEGQRTVAGELRHALETLLRRPCELVCAGRTDAGVSATAQHVSLPLLPEELEREPRRLWRSLAAITPEDISIRGLYLAPSDFSARFDAQSRAYRYRIVYGNAQPVLLWGFAWWIKSPLDVDAMVQAAAPLVGEHDFTSFCKVSSAQQVRDAGRSLSRCLQRVEVHATQEMGEDVLAIDVTGNAFLHNMVRIIVGSLVEVGRGNRPVSWLVQALERRDRRAAGPTAPAEGLVLNGVRYPDGVLVPWH
ncbi:MAG: tRNA pseudouridine(38-40) synthase TruA [Atopobiaceae bacterium]|nr:tRNA pseudouridine(38-40) synthase TruA [Atopobiaceae bacterium]